MKHPFANLIRCYHPEQPLGFNLLNCEVHVPFPDFFLTKSVPSLTQSFASFLFSRKSRAVFP